MQKVVLKAFVVVLLVIIVTPRVSFGWGREGHQIVAMIAQDRLTPAAQAGVTELLGKETTLSDVANWADEIRQERPEAAPWHYIDIPYEMSGYNKERDGKNGNNVIDKIVEFAGVLNDRSQPKEKRVEALKFVVHFVGDIHQPLHCAERNGDKGGNMRLVFFLNDQKAVNLHKVWDSVIIKHAMDSGGKTSTADYAQKLNDAIDAKQAKTWLNETPEQWANESHALAVKVAYADFRADGPPPKITEKYLEIAEPTVNEQLEKGGVRLAELLNRIFR